MAKWQKVVVSGSSAALAGLSVDATITGDISGDAGGNAATATALANARTIGGVSFNGTANIDLPGVNTTGDQNTSGNAATATQLATSRDLQVSLSSTSAQGFNGSGNATSIGVSGTLGTAQGGLGFAPTLANNGGKVIKVKSDASGFELADDDASSVTPTSTTTFTNKSIDLSSNTVTGTLAEFNTAVSDATLVDLDDSQTLTNKTIDSDNNTITNIVNADIKASAAIAFSKMENLTQARALVSDSNGDVSVSDVTATEIGYLDGVSSAIQTQLDTKATSTALTNGLAAKQDTIDSSNRLNANLIGANGDVSNAEYGFLNGVTSAIQTQLDGKIGANNTALTGTTTAEALTVSGNVVLGDALSDTVTVEGDLRVKGTASFESSENLLVKDQFIGLGSGSAAGQDGGIVIEDSVSNGGQGHAFAWKDGGGADANGNNRWVVAKDVPFNSTSISPDAFMAAVLAPGTANSPTAIAAIDTDYNKTGNIYTTNDSTGNEIWIYA